MNKFVLVLCSAIGYGRRVRRDAQISRKSTQHGSTVESLKSDDLAHSHSYSLSELHATGKVNSLKVVSMILVAFSPTVAFKTFCHRSPFLLSTTVSAGPCRPILDGHSRLDQPVMERGRLTLESSASGEISAGDLEEFLVPTLPACEDLRGTVEFFRKTYRASKRTYGRDHPQTLIRKNDLASALFFSNDLKRAQKLQLEILETRTLVLGPEHRDTLVSKSNLASTTCYRLDHEKAKQLEREASEAMTQTLGPEHPDTLRSKNNLASMLLYSKDIQGAEELQREVLAVSSRTLGPEHPSTITSKNNLASVLLCGGDLENAQMLQQEVLEVRNRTLGPEHPDTLASKSTLASTLFKRKDLEGAEMLQQEVVEVMSRIFGPQHPGTLRAVDDLNSIVTYNGATEDAHEGASNLTSASLSSKSSLAIKNRRQRTLGSSLESARKLLAHFGTGAKALMSDARMWWRLKRQKSTSLSWRERALLRRLPLDLARMLPVIVNPVPPPIGMSVPLIATAFPHKLLTRQFWTDHQQFCFHLADHTRRWAAPLVRQQALLEAQGATSVEDAQVTLQQGAASGTSTLSEESYLSSMTRKQLKALGDAWSVFKLRPSRLCSTARLRKRLRKVEAWLREDDRLLSSTDLSTLEDHELWAACLLRGLRVQDGDPRMALRAWLRFLEEKGGWTRIPPAMLLHAPLLLQWDLVRAESNIPSSWEEVGCPIPIYQES